MKFKKLEQVLDEDPVNGLSVTGYRLIPFEEPKPLKKLPLLKHYFVDSSIQGIIDHNLRWANGQEEKPRFKFAYIMLPTGCNQRCMGCFTGKDKSRLPLELDGPFYSNETIDDITGFLKDHGAESVVYGGGGELFKWKGAFDYIERITDSGLGMVIFTNGSLLSKVDVEWLSQRDISLIISIRDTTEKQHNLATGISGFMDVIQTLEYALQTGMHEQNRLAVEIPVTNNNEKRIFLDFLPAMRYLGVIPFIEEFIQITTSEEEKTVCHDFRQARKFFDTIADVDRQLGYNHEPVFGQRILAQPKCERSLYSFTIYPSGDVGPCPSHFLSYGNFLRMQNFLPSL